MLGRGMEEVSWSEVLNVVQSRLNTQLKKASMYPELLGSCQRTARDLKTLKLLKKKGAELRLVGTFSDFRIHAIGERFRQLYKVCSAINNMYIQRVGNEVIALTDVIYKRMRVAVYLGERHPLIRFSTDPVILTRQEFKTLYNEIVGYCQSIGHPPPEVSPDKVEPYDEFIIRTDETNPPRYKTLMNIYAYAEKYDFVSVALTPEEVAREEEMERQSRERFEAVSTIVNELIQNGRELDEGRVYEVDVSMLERLCGLPVSDIAEKAVLVKVESHLSPFYITSTALISMPTNCLHALRILKDRWLYPSFARLRNKYRHEIRLPKTYGILVKKLYTPKWDYEILIFPKPTGKLPPIKTAKIIQSEDRIVLVNP
jgi:hypothetical protein